MFGIPLSGRGMILSPIDLPWDLVLPVDTPGLYDGPAIAWEILMASGSPGRVEKEYRLYRPQRGRMAGIECLGLVYSTKRFWSLNKILLYYYGLGWIYWSDAFWIFYSILTVPFLNWKSNPEKESYLSIQLGIYFQNEIMKRYSPGNKLHHIML